MDDVVELGNQVRLACQRISRRIRYESYIEVAPHHYSVLVHLEGRPRTPGELADIERVSAPSMTRTINALEEVGHVRRDLDPADGRQKLVSLTTSGREVLARTRVQRDGWMVRHLDGLTPDELAALREAAVLLTKVANAP